MARAIDPHCPRFLGTLRLPGGRYRGRTLVDIGSTIDGLLYLYQLIHNQQHPSFVQPLLIQVVEDFLEQPAQQQALFQSRGRR